MRAVAEKTPAVAPSRAVAQLAGARHGRSAAAMDAAATPLEEYPVQRAAISGQRVLQRVANQSTRTRPMKLASPQSQRVAQLQELVRR